MAFQRISRKSVPLALLPILAAGGLLLLVPEPVVLPEPVPPPRASADRVVVGDEELRGVILREGQGHVVIRTDDGRQRLVEKERIRSIVRGEEARGPWRRVRLRNGRELSGRLIAEGPDSLELELASGTRVGLRRADVASIVSGR